MNVGLIRANHSSLPFGVEHTHITVPLHSNLLSVSKSSAITLRRFPPASDLATRYNVDLVFQFLFGKTAKSAARPSIGERLVTDVKPQVYAVVLAWEECYCAIGVFQISLIRCSWTSASAPFMCLV